MSMRGYSSMRNRRSVILLEYLLSLVPSSSIFSKKDGSSSTEERLGDRAGFAGTDSNSIKGENFDVSILV